MRLLIVGSLQGQIGAATKIAMDRGAKVTHAARHRTGLASLRGGHGADLVLCDVSLDIGDLVRGLAPNASARRWWPAASAPTRAARWTRSAPAPRNICRCRPIPN
jgi:hypothetical protein